MSEFSPADLSLDVGSRQPLTDDRGLMVAAGGGKTRPSARPGTPRVLTSFATSHQIGDCSLADPNERVETAGVYLPNVLFRLPGDGFSTVGYVVLRAGRSRRTRD